MRVKCTECGKSYELPMGKREDYERACAIVDTILHAKSSQATRALVATLLLRQLVATLGLPPTMIGLVADGYNAIVERAFAARRHRLLRLVN